MIYSLTADEHARTARVDELVARGGVVELIAALSEPSWTVRRSVVAGLASLGDEAVAPLCQWLAMRRTSEHAIAAAVDALVASLGKTVISEVAKLLGSPTGAVVEDAARILGRRREARAVDMLVELVANPSGNIALAAIEALGEIGGSASVDVLVGVIRTRDFFRTFPAMQVAARTADPRVVAPIAELLDDELFRDEAARALGRTGSSLAIAPLATLLHDHGSVVVATVATALDELIARASFAGADATVVSAIRDAFAGDVDHFVAAATTRDAATRSAAIRVLGAVGTSSTVSVLAKLVDDPEFRAAAVAALQRLLRRDDRALTAALALPTTRATALPLVTAKAMGPVVRELLHDDDAEVRARACETLARIGDTTAVRTLFGVLADPSPRVAHAATAAIGSLGVDETPTLAKEALASTNAGVRRQALRVIAYFGCRDTVDAVIATIADPDERIAELAVAALTSCDDPQIDGVLARVATDKLDALRAAAMRAAGHRGGARMLDLLAAGCGDRAGWVRYYACQGLGRLGDNTASDRVVALLHDPLPHVRIVAIEALAHLDNPIARAALEAAARSTDLDERRAALIGIANDTSIAAVDLLVDAAATGDVSTRLVALAGLAQASDPRALTCLASAVRDPDVDVRDAALSLVAERGDRAAADLLIDVALANGPDHPAHAAVSRASKIRAEAIAARLANASEIDASPLASALARMGAPDAVRALFDTLSGPNPAARRAAAAALVELDAEGAVAAVRRLATDDPDVAVRRACAAALGI